MVLAHSIFHSAEGVPLPAWLGDLVLVGLPLLALSISLVVLELRTRPDHAPENDL